MSTWADLEKCHEHHMTTLLAFQHYVVKHTNEDVRLALLPILTTWTRWVFDWDGGGDVTTEWTGPLDLLADMVGWPVMKRTVWSYAQMFVDAEIHLLKQDTCTDCGGNLYTSPPCK